MTIWLTKEDLGNDAFEFFLFTFLGNFPVQRFQGFLEISKVIVGIKVESKYGVNFVCIKIMLLAKIIMKSNIFVEYTCMSSRSLRFPHCNQILKHKNQYIRGFRAKINVF